MLIVFKLVCSCYLVEPMNRVFPGPYLGWGWGWGTEFGFRIEAPKCPGGISTNWGDSGRTEVSKSSPQADCSPVVYGP